MSRKTIAVVLITLVAFEIVAALLSALSPSLYSLALGLSLLVPALLLATMFNSTIYGMRWAVQIAGAIGKERELRRYDLLALMPTGAAGVCMTICAGCVNMNATFQKIPRFENIRMSRSQVVFMALIALLVLYSFLSVEQPREAPLFYIGGLLVALAAYYLDYLQAVVLACLVGMLVSTHVQTQLDSRLWSGLGFLLLQFATYLLTLLVGIVILPAVYRALHISSWVADLTILLLTLTAFGGIREGLSEALLRIVTYRLKMV